MNVLLFIIILLVLIIVHEFGHFILAKRSGIRVDEFGIGFPPRALTLFRKGETAYTLNWLPIGGFVKIFGEDPDDPEIKGADYHRSFVAKPKLLQAFVLVAGVLFNILTAWFLFWIVFMVGAPSVLSPEETGTVTDQELAIVQVLQNSPAEEAGFLAGDSILELRAGEEELLSPTAQTASDFIAERAGTPISVTIARDKETLNITAIPKAGLVDSEPDRAVLGFAMAETGIVSYAPHTALFESFIFTGETLWAVTVGIVTFLLGALTFSADLSQIAGPVGIVGLVGDAASLGVVSLLMFTAFISLNLAVVNLIPVPALDGGRLLFVLIEAVKGSSINPGVAARMNAIGFFLLILLMIVVTYNDILRIFS
jgi:regulator of sigma E protease